jgi:hypothetical protein
MKNVFLILSTILITSTIYAQSYTEEIDLFQAAFGMDKKSMVAEFVKPSMAQENAFWNLYDAYEIKRKALGKERIQLLSEYADKFQSMTPQQADEWTKQLIQLQKKTDKLIAKYYGKVKSISDGMVATQFYQIETYILTAIRMEILNEVPFVEDKR